MNQVKVILKRTMCLAFFHCCFQYEQYTYNVVWLLRTRYGRVTFKKLSPASKYNFSSVPPLILVTCETVFLWSWYSDQLAKEKLFLLNIEPYFPESESNNASVMLCQLWIGKINLSSPLWENMCEWQLAILLALGTSGGH